MKIESGVVESVSQEVLDMTRIPMDDKESLKKLNDCDVFGIFQFETRVAVGIIKEIGIDTFEDMYAATTLGRPDPLSSNLHVKYGQRKRNEEYWESIPVIADIMDQSYGLPIFQESCCIGETLILTPDGKISLKDIVENECIKTVMCVNDENDLVERDILQRHKMGKKEVFELTLGNGCKVTCTSDHKILTSNREYVQAEFLEKDDDIVCATDHSKLIKVESMGFQETYDLGVDQYHNYIANDIIVHNCMLLGRRLAGFSGSEANALRKGLAKGKDNEDAMKKLKKLMGEFKERSQQAIEDELLSQDQLDEYVRILESFGGYGFNKSLSGDTLVKMADGSSKRLIEIHPGESLICYDDGEFKSTKAVNIHDHGILDTFRITFDDGSFVDSSIQHKFMTREGMTPLYKIIDNQLEIGYSDSEHLSFRRIISVKPLGKRHLYDLEVCNKSHNFCLQNRIVTSNSHAVSYAMVAYWSLYLKTYFPVEFMVSLLNFTDLSKKDEKGGAVLKKYIQYAKKLDVKISPPNINTSGVRFCLDGDTIRWGMSMVKGVANASVEEIILKRPFTSFSDFLDKVEKRKVNKSKVTALIKCGAFDEFGDREYLINHYIGEVRKEKGYEFIAFGDEEKRAAEEELLGMAISFSVLPKDIDYEQLEREYGILSLKELENTESGVFIGKIGQIKKKNSQKSGKLMLIVDFADDFDDKSFFVWEKDIDFLEKTLITGHIMTVPLRKFDINSDGCFYCGPQKDLVDLTED